MTLGDHFPTDGKVEFIDKNLDAKHVIYLFVTYTTPPKEKYLLIIQVDHCVRAFTINSEINKFVKMKQHLLDDQVLVPCSEHSFLKHDSYIDCTRIRDVSTDDIHEQILRDMGRIKGTISGEVCNNVLLAVKNSMNLSPLDIALISDALSN